MRTSSTDLFSPTVFGVMLDLGVVASRGRQGKDPTSNRRSFVLAGSSMGGRSSGFSCCARFVVYGRRFPLDLPGSLPENLTFGTKKTISVTLG